jgi:hypothetical protein
MNLFINCKDIYRNSRIKITNTWAVAIRQFKNEMLPAKPSNRD